jgi:NTE family protein
MRDATCAFYGKRREVLARLWKARPLAFTDLLRGRSLTPQFDPAVILESFVPGYELLPETFEELQIPLKIVACDFYAWTEAILSEGLLRPAIAASIAIPALFRPVKLDGRILIDGGACNPSPSTTSRSARSPSPATWRAAPTRLPTGGRACWNASSGRRRSPCNR